MIADFIHLHTVGGYKNVFVMLGLEEHKYVQLAKLVAERMKLDVNIGGIYGRVIRGLGGFPDNLCHFGKRTLSNPSQSPKIFGFQELHFVIKHRCLPA
jgi:hypothetical protein